MTAPAEEWVEWRYTFCDLLTNRTLAVLPLRDVDLTETIGGPGAGKGTVPLSSEAVRARDPWGATTPRRTICWAQRVHYRGGAEVAAPVLWHGIVWDADPTPTGITLDLATPESYYEKRLVPRDHRWDQTDDAVMLRDLFRMAEEEPRGRLGLLYTDTLAGVRSDRSLVYDDLKPVLEVAQSIASAGDGLDWRIRPGIDPASGAFTKTLEVAPRLGRKPVPELTWQSASPARAENEAVGYSYPIKGSGVVNTVIGLGDGQGETGLRSRATAADLGNTELEDGYPLLEAAYTGGSQLKTQDTLDRHTRGALSAALNNERRVESLTVRGDRAPSVERYGLGDEATLRINDLSQPHPVTVQGRIVARRFIPAQPGRNELVALTLGET